jgi:hypothetical protein
MNNVGLSLNKTNWGLHLYVEDTVIYSLALSVQLGFDSLQESLPDLKFVLIVDNTKFTFSVQVL